MGGKTVAVPPASEVFVEGLLDPPVSVLARLISEEARPIDQEVQLDPLCCPRRCRHRGELPQRSIYERENTSNLYQFMKSTQLGLTPCLRCVWQNLQFLTLQPQFKGKNSLCLREHPKNLVQCFH